LFASVTRVIKRLWNLPETLSGGASRSREKTEPIQIRAEAFSQADSYRSV